MTEEQQIIRITRESLRDGTLIEAARRHAPPGMRIRSDAEIAACLNAILADHPPDEDVWLFGYGSLMWNPAMHFTELRGGRVLGWHREYCLWLEGGRGSPENPGLMLGLDRGGAAAGALFRVPARLAREELLLPFRRELFTHSYDPRWVSVATPRGVVRAVTFVVNRAGARYVKRLDLERVAHHVATASGSLGSCMEYLRRTLESLDALGLDDRMLRQVYRICTGQGAAPPAVSVDRDIYPRRRGRA
jgi:glutathione-specific gamma-glutamylcyclotransferase